MVIDKSEEPLALTISAIEHHLGDTVSAGVIVLGRYKAGNVFEVAKVDRSDSHVRARLWAYISDFPYFSFRLCVSADEAYLLHCRLFHQLKPTNEQHPERPKDSKATCPVCGSSLDSTSRGAVA